MQPLDISQLLDQNVGIESIKNDVNIDEETAILRCDFGNEKLTVLWTCSTGFSIPVFINNKCVLKHIENQLIRMTTFNGYSSELEPKGLVQNTHQTQK